ncbi:hypothetical protein Pelo_6168 [Pelomyxa schiedti]|nr:hypothetical protein Pelo_6168 [Pelomyxa schiedti]
MSLCWLNVDIYIPGGISGGNVSYLGVHDTAESSSRGNAASAPLRKKLRTLTHNFQAPPKHCPDLPAQSYAEKQQSSEEAPLPTQVPLGEQLRTTSTTTSVVHRTRLPSRAAQCSGVNDDDDGDDDNDGGGEEGEEEGDCSQPEQRAVEGCFDSCVREGRTSVIVRCLLKTNKCAICYDHKGNEALVIVRPGVTPPTVPQFYLLGGVHNTELMLTGAYNINPESITPAVTAIQDKYLGAPRMDLRSEAQLEGDRIVLVDAGTQESVDLIFGVVEKVNGNTYSKVLPEGKEQHKLFIKKATLDLLPDKCLTKGNIYLAKGVDIGCHDRYTIDQEVKFFVSEKAFIMLDPPCSTL